MIETLPESLICDYQYRMSEFIQEHPYCAAWLDMGLGKTVITLMALQALMDDFMTAHTLVIGRSPDGITFGTLKFRRSLAHPNSG
jgi:hypothetical protein